MADVSTTRILLAWRPGDGGPGSVGADTAATVAWMARSGPLSVRPVCVIPRIWPENAGDGLTADPATLHHVNDWARAETAACLEDACTALREAGVPDEAVDTGVSDNAGGTGAPLLSHSETTALITAATDFDADVILIGSREDAPAGRFRAGATADALLHCSPLPVLVAPHLPTLSSHGVTRVTCAYVDTEQSQQALRHASDLAVRYGVPLRLVAFSPVGTTMYPPRVPLPGGADQLERWRPQAESIIDHGRRRALERHPDLEVQTGVGTGDGWAEAIGDLRWKKGDLLVVGSSVLGAFNRVFIGPSTNQILRHSPAPVLVSAV
ncbi:universal stress protein [uncultured Corynebacterium sp.]|uniref:universal stress protein n=1 Tax=uncultured Corynebacterium sp. TaxID=159447 RepID=UPI0025CEF813|nr:universal stress protein [uncultured Corynebacterium sp.]